MFGDDEAEAFQYFAGGLMELRLRRIALQDLC